MPIATYTGADTWFDDISDGPVWCRLKLKGQAEPIVLTAWTLVGSPKYAPELRNISTLDDVMFDVGVRFQNLVPELYNDTRNGGYNPNYQASYERDIEPILERIGDYIWVANVQSMVSFISPRFNPRDASPANAEESPDLLLLLPRLLGERALRAAPDALPQPRADGAAQLRLELRHQRRPGQVHGPHAARSTSSWGSGRRGSSPRGRVKPWPNSVHPLDRASAGNCVGHPMSPGIETTWNAAQSGHLQRAVSHQDP